MKIDSTKYGTPTEAADAIGVARTTLITAVSRGEIKHTRTIGGSMLGDTLTLGLLATLQPAITLGFSVCFVVPKLFPTFCRKYLLSLLHCRRYVVK